MSLYQKYRPKDFETLVEQDFVRSALSNALSQGRTVHAYLFYGSRWTGKTTVARIFAKAVNCRSIRKNGDPCGECEPCKAFEEGRMLDVIEIDAASNNGVEHVRDLIERSRFQPTIGTFKVYIVDEVHMLSKGAFNALLKTLEEPPEHVKFVLATTDIGKVPETVVSRTQRYDFRRISETSIAKRLAEVAASEGIEAEAAAIARISRLARGGLRDALTLFEQFVLDGRVTSEYVERRLGLVGADFLSALEASVANADSSEIFARTEDLRTRSSDPLKFAEELLSYLRDRIVSVGVRSPEFPFLSRFFQSVSEAYPRMKASPDPLATLEAGLAEIAYCGIAASMPAVERLVAPALAATPKAIIRKELFKPEPAIHKEEAIPPTPPAQGAAPGESVSVQNTEPAKTPADFSVAALVSAVGATPRSAALTAAIKTANRCAFDEDGTFVIDCSHSIHHGQVSKPENQALILESLEKLTGLSPKISVRSHT